MPTPEYVATHIPPPTHAWSALEVTAAAGEAIRFTQSDTYCETFVVIADGANVYYGPGADKALILATDDVARTHDPLSRRYNLKDWYLAGTQAGGEKLQVLYA